MALSLSLPIDFKGWARTSKLYQGHFLLAQMERLKPHLHEAGACLKDEFVSGTLQFGVDDEGWNFIKGRVDGTLLLTCQRCLKGVKHTAQLDFRLCFVQNEAESAHIPDYYEPLILKEFSGKLEDIIEDELLLNLPIVVFHAWDECLLEENAKKVLQKTAQWEEGAQRKPFSELKKQLGRSGF